MPMNRREFLSASVAGAALLQQGMKAFGDPAATIQVAIDAAKVGAPIDPMIFGGYMEPATTQVWAEMLTDRKFANPISSAHTEDVSRKLLTGKCPSARVVSTTETTWSTTPV